MIKQPIWEHLFKEVLAHKDMIEKCSMKGFQCFEVNFFYVNQNNWLIKKVKGEYAFRTNDIDRLQGLDLVWQYAINNQVLEVRQRSRNFLIDLHLNSDQEKYTERGKINKEFLNRWLVFFNQQANITEDQIHNFLLVLFNYVYKFDGLGIHEEPIDFS